MPLKFGHKSLSRSRRNQHRAHFTIVNLNAFKGKCRGTYWIGSVFHLAYILPMNELFEEPTPDFDALFGECVFRCSEQNENCRNNASVYGESKPSAFSNHQSRCNSKYDSKEGNQTQANGGAKHYRFHSSSL